MATNRTLREIDLESNNIADEGCKAFGPPSFVQLQSCIQYFCSLLTGAFPKAFAEALQINNAITKIILLRNRIGDEGSKAWFLHKDLSLSRILP